jgi:hypothetical protein
MCTPWSRWMVTAQRRDSLLRRDKPTATVFEILPVFGRILGAPRVWFFLRERARTGLKTCQPGRVK